MHDPLCVAFEIPRPWPSRSKLSGRWWWPPLITVWHREPGGHDAGAVCPHYVPQIGVRHGWRWHIHHWRLQIHPLQQLRRWLLTRCTWCAGPHRRTDPVNHSLTWDGPRGRWWQGETGLYHDDCASYQRARAACTCDKPLLEHAGYGRCALCHRHRPFGATPTRVEIARLLQGVPPGRRAPHVIARVRHLAAVNCDPGRAGAGRA